MRELVEKHYGKAVAAVVAWATEALFDLSQYLKALLP
jgi:hypothetical protein